MLLFVQNNVVIVLLFEVSRKRGDRFLLLFIFIYLLFLLQLWRIFLQLKVVKIGMRLIAIEEVGLLQERGLSKSKRRYEGAII